jgi:hypothetical protein
MLRPAFIYTVAFTTLGCCPEHIDAGEPCKIWHKSSCVAQGEPHNCGLNGFTCEGGKWKADFTYCNPAAPPRP